jgi:hypothetical protein
MNAADFTSLLDRAGAAVTTFAGEEVTIGAWAGKAPVTGGPHYLANARGGTYEQEALVISPLKKDLDGFVPLEQMDVVARGRELRIPDEGIVEYADRYVITAVGRNVPSKP